MQPQNETLDNPTRGQVLADKLAQTVGSWPFIIIQSILFSIWMICNTVAWIQHWDPYPFILLNLVLSFQAATTGPVIMMSNNRQAAKDRLANEMDYAINRLAVEKLTQLCEHLGEHTNLLNKILTELEQDNTKN